MTEIHEAEIETEERIRKLVQTLQKLQLMIEYAADSIATLKQEVERLQPIEGGICEHCGTAVCTHVLGYMRAVSGKPTAS